MSIFGPRASSGRFEAFDLRREVSEVSTPIGLHEVDENQDNNAVKSRS